MQTRAPPIGEPEHVTWLMLPVAAGAGLLFALLLAGTAPVPPLLAWHAGLMVAAWGVLLPGGALVARYGKRRPAGRFPHLVEDLTWWAWHRPVQYAGLALAVAGLGCAAMAVGGGARSLHALCGAVVMALGLSQTVAALLRGTKGGPTGAGADPARPETWRGDHYDMTPRRRRFEAYHKPAGWLACGLAVPTLLLGAALAGAGTAGILLLGLVHGALMAWAVDGIVRGRHLSSFEALWDRSEPPAA